MQSTLACFLVLSSFTLRLYLERDVLVAQSDFQFLPAVLVLLRPLRIVFLHDFTILDDPLDL